MPFIWLMSDFSSDTAESLKQYQLLQMCLYGHLLGKQAPLLSLLWALLMKARRWHRSKDLKELNWFVVPLKSFILWNNRRHSESVVTGIHIYYIYNVFFIIEQILVNWALNIWLGCHCTSGQQETTALMVTGKFTGMRLRWETLIHQGHLYLKGYLPRLVNILSNNLLFSLAPLLHSALSVCLSLHVCPAVWKKKPQ